MLAADVPLWFAALGLVVPAAVALITIRLTTVTIAIFGRNQAGQI